MLSNAHAQSHSFGVSRMLGSLSKNKFLSTIATKIIKGPLKVPTLLLVYKGGGGKEKSSVGILNILKNSQRSVAITNQYA